MKVDKNVKENNNKLIIMWALLYCVLSDTAHTLQTEKKSAIIEIFFLKISIIAYVCLYLKRYLSSMYTGSVAKKMSRVIQSCQRTRERNIDWETAVAYVQ